MKSHIFGAMLLGVALLAGPAHAGLVTINFDDLTDLAVLTNQYASVAFSAGGGDVVLATAQNPPYLGTAPNLICTGSVAGVIDCTNDIILTFTVPVDNLSFRAFGNQTAAPGVFALADVFFAAAPSITNIAMHVSHTITCGMPTVDCDPDPQSLPYVGITKVIFHNNTDPKGTAYDDFTFTVEAGTTAAPEPSTWMLTGISGLIWAGRRRLLARRKSRN